jgi:hypothetical protein
VDTVDSWEVCGSRLKLLDFRGALQLLLVLLLLLLQLMLKMALY